MMPMTKIIKVFGFEINEEQYPKLYKLGGDDFGRLKIVVLTVKDFYRDLNWEEVARKIEASPAVEIAGERMDILSLPAVYCWYVHKPEEFEKFFVETVKRLWSGENKLALKKMEEYFERGVK